MKRANGWIESLIAVALVASASAVALAKPPAGKEPTPPPPGKEPAKLPTNLPPNIRAATSQPGGREVFDHLIGPPAPPPAAHAPPGVQTPTPTVQLKPGEVPKIDFDTPIYDFGRIKTGKDVEHDFWFHNSGNGPLEIVQVKPS